MAESVITVENLGKKYRLGVARHDTLRDRLMHAVRAPFRRPADRLNGGSDEFWALQDVSFEVKRGEVLGIIGRNGAGKSTLLKILSRITEPTKGRVSIRGRVASLLEVGTGFHPELSGRENIFLNGAVLGMTRAEIARKFDEIVAFAEVERFLDTPVKHYSSGMYVRLAFAVAAHLEPEILIVDEVLAVGDAQFQKKCLGKMQDVAHHHGRTVLFVSHNLQQVGQLCTDAFVLRSGQISFRGAAHAALQHYHVSTEPSAQKKDTAAKARISRVIFHDEHGGVGPRVSRSDQVRFTVEFEAAFLVAKPLISIAVMHGEGQAVFSEHWCGANPLPAGRHRLRGQFAASHLKTEPYFLTTHFYDGEQFLDVMQGTALPEIVDPAANPHVESRRWGIARVPVTWETT